jgi:hypothetical protein
VIACLSRGKRVPGSRALAGTLKRTQSHATALSRTSHSHTGRAPNHWETKHGNERTDEHDSEDDDDNKHGDYCLLVNAALGCLLTIAIVIAGPSRLLANVVSQQASVILCCSTSPNRHINRYGCTPKGWNS